MVKKIVVIKPLLNPVSSSPYVLDDMSNIIVEFIGIEGNKSGIASVEDKAGVAPEIIKAGLKAYELGADGIIVNCIAEPGLAKLRNMVDIPVLGLLESSLHWSKAFGKKVGLLIPKFGDKYLTLIKDMLRYYGDKSICLIEIDINNTKNIGLYLSQQKQLASINALIVSSTYLVKLMPNINSYFSCINVSIEVINPLQLAIQSLMIS